MIDYLRFWMTGYLFFARPKCIVAGPSRKGVSVLRLTDFKISQFSAVARPKCTSGVQKINKSIAVPTAGPMAEIHLLKGGLGWSKNQ